MVSMYLYIATQNESGKLKIKVFSHKYSKN